MANIATELTTIRTGIYGKDIRAAIGDGIEKINNDAEDILAQLTTIEDAVTASEVAQAAAESAKSAAEIAATHAMSGTPEGYADLVDNVTQLDDAVANIPTWEISRDQTDTDYIVLQDSNGENASRVFAPTSQMASIINTIYPVGSIYMSMNATDPGTFLDGTTWERLENRFLLGASSTYLAGNEGGSATHTLTVNEMPSHSHTVGGVGVAAGSGSKYALDLKAYSASLSWRNGTSSAGSNQPFSIMPPYLAVYMWKRTA